MDMKWIIKDYVDINMKERMKDMETHDLKGPMTRGRLRRLEEELKKSSSLHFLTPKLYKLQWLSKRGELVVDRQVVIAFTEGNYSDEVMCGVAIHILLSRLWKFDRKVTYSGITNMFSFEHMGHKVNLKSLSLKEVCADQIKMRAKRKEEKKESEKN
ncbi:hypothetical protein CR513_05680, partial [Mucuna pruriens]